jgi:LuxR family maltose regulon positive regulatory protein
MTKQDLQKANAARQLFLERPRVDRILEKAFQSHVVTVVAGEGNGKTHAVHSFLQKDRRPVIWIQISEWDNLIWHFWENYTGEIARLNPEAAKIFSEIGFPETDRQFDQYLGMIRNEIITRKQYVIVFDDFHLLTNPRILLYLYHTLSTPVSKNTAVFISRTEPGLNTLGFLARGLLSQVTVEDLRFSDEEISEYFTLNHISLNTEEFSRICQDTEGWAMAVDLIVQEIRAGALEGNSSGWDRIMRPIRNIEEEMFSAMDGELQKFLIKLSLVDHWPQEFLERLDPEGKNIAAMEQFSSLIRFDTYLHGFRIHRLFVDFLREKQRNLLPEEIRAVHIEGARWCMENKLFANAAMQYEQAGDYSGLIRIVKSLPPLLSGPMASFFLDLLERMIPGLCDTEEREELLYLWFVVRPRLLMILGRYRESSEEYQKGLRRIESRPPSPWRSVCLSRICCSMGILNFFSCRYTKNYGCAPWFERAYQYCLENPQGFPDQILQTNTGPYTLQVGPSVTPEEIEAFIQDLTLAVPPAAAFMRGFLFGIDALARAELAYYQGDLSVAEQFARQAVYQGREKKQYEVENRGLFFLLRIYVHSGSFAEIRSLERQLEAQLEIPEFFNRQIIYELMMGRFYTRIGLIEKIAPWLRNEVDDRELHGMFRGFDILIKVRCFMTEKKYFPALRVLEEEKSRGDLESFILGKLEIMVLEAASRYHLGEEEEALRILEAAYEIAAPNALIMFFIELGEEMRILAGAALSRQEGGIPRPWLESIRGRASAYSKQGTLVAEQYRAGEPEEPKPEVYLTRREREVLAGLARGLNREDIAGETGITLNTVKTVIRDIYRKLGALNRADAIRIAGSLGIMPSGCV